MGQVWEEGAEEGYPHLRVSLAIGEGDEADAGVGRLEGKSVFRTPDSVNGRGEFASARQPAGVADRAVGVVGSGKGMAHFERMGKHKFEVEREE